MFYFFDVVSVLGEFMLVFDQFYIDKFLIDKFYQYRLVSFNISILDIQVV